MNVNLDSVELLAEKLNVSPTFVARVADRLGHGVGICHALAYKSGWWDDKPKDPKQLGWLYATKLALVHSEVSEALEGLRKDKMDDHLPHRKAVEVELADAVIRIFDLAGAMDLYLAGAIIEKLAYNQQRADHKKEAREAVGGKSF